MLKKIKNKSEKSKTLYTCISKKKMMEKEAQKKTSVILLLIAIIFAITMTMYTLNYFQSSKVTQAEPKESSSGGISLIVREPPIVKDESAGSVSLEVLPSEK